MHKKILILLSIILVTQLGFLLPLAGTLLLLKNSFQAVQHNDVQKSESYLKSVGPLLAVTNASYTLATPLFVITGTKNFMDQIISITKETYELNKKADKVLLLSEDLLPQILQPHKSDSQKKQIQATITNLNQLMREVSPELSTLINNLNLPQMQNWKDKLAELKQKVEFYNSLAPSLPDLLGAKEEKKYVVFFLNNRELRPGGGFIGSFGIVTVKDFGVEDIEIHDVYDADGQLKMHVDAPAGLHYLNIYDLFLRDSNFSPDFSEDVKIANFFLEQEIGLKDVTGFFGVTTSAIENMLDAYGDVYVNDFNDTINKNNFYIKTQTYVESNFFPGSTQKKTFLSSVFSALLQNMSKIDKHKMVNAIDRSLQQKQIVLNFVDNRLQKVIKASEWSGTIPQLPCEGITQACVSDYIFSVDANVGGNKANYYVTKTQKLHVSIDENGIFKNTLTIAYKNDSPGEAFPTGNYKNYIQLFLPRTADLYDVSINSNQVKNDLRESGQMQIVSFLVEVPVQKQSIVTVDYGYKQKLLPGRNIYQLTVPKQIGSKNDEFELELLLPKKVAVVQQNYPAFVQKNLVVYKTIVAQDLLFSIQLKKQ